MSDDGGVGRPGRPSAGDHRVTEETLLRVVKYGFAGVFLLLSVGFLVPPVTARIRSSPAVMLGFVLVVFVVVVAAVGALVVLNRRN